MPKINKVFSLDITPQQFIDNCSDVELKELALLLFSKNNNGFTKIESPNIHCHCPSEEQTGTTTIQCCNVCGLPDEDFWRPVDAGSDLNSFK